MQYHHYGYVSEDPKWLPAAGVGLDRPEELPDEMDVLIVGGGPAGMITAAQLSMFPDVHTRLIEKRAGRLEVGQADGIQSRSMETFQAFNFANELQQEAFTLTEATFWNPDPQNPGNIVRTARPLDDEHDVSEFPHVIVNQARVLDYFVRYMAQSPSRMAPDYGWEFVDLEIAEDPTAEEYPVAVRLKPTGAGDDRIRTVHTKYVVGGDGAGSRVRRSIGRSLDGSQSDHAWGVMDVTATTDFPDIRTKSAIHSETGSILLIPREGGYLFRMYVDLGEVPEDDNRAIRNTPVEDIIAKANEILRPYHVDVKEVAWSSVYEVSHRLVDSFDNLPLDAPADAVPQVFLAGDACHTDLTP